MAVLAVIIVAASIIAVHPTTQPVTVVGSNGANGGNGGTTATDTTAAPSGSAAVAGGTFVPGQAGTTGSNSAGHAGGTTASACNVQGNGGSTDTGVTSSQIKLASTIVNSGVGSSFLGPVQYGMQAVVNKVNRAGGICGRQLALTLVDDGWNAQVGCQDIQNFIHDGAFALPVEPSSEGLTTCIANSTIHTAGIPVIGSDGMLKQQYQATGQADWVWPIATSTVSTMHIMAIDAYKNHGARTFCLAYDDHYRFGQEGQQAFDSEVQRLGGQLVYDQPLDPTVADYSQQINTFNSTCQGKADFVGLLLQPTAAQSWITGGAYMGNPSKGGAAGAQPMFTSSLGKNCGNFCSGLKVYSGFRPPLAPYDSMASVRQYINDVTAQSSSADLDNQFLESGYDGMLLTVQALTAVGPNLTRARVRAYLDSTGFATDGQGLSQPVIWHPGNHFANTAMLGYTMVANSAGFQGFRADPTGFIVDPNPSADT
jgi:ABC-type branched-subunit amino acid transport system substrate-binding protein